MSVFKSNRFTVSQSRKPGKVIVTTLPPTDTVRSSKPKTWSPAQKEHLNRVEAAKEFARMAISDPELNAYYAEKARRLNGIGAWHIAISDYYYPPWIHRADFHDFSGKMGSMVTIEAYDNYEVKGVNMKIASAAGVILSEIEATPGPYKIGWVCKLDADIDLFPGSVITLGARDIPGNITRVELTWPFDSNRDIYFESKLKKGSRRGEKSQLRIRK
ncbi:MAG: hypothetical protein ACOYNC_08995 [Bacteroidales bacterium]